VHGCQQNLLTVAAVSDHPVEYHCREDLVTQRYELGTDRYVAMEEMDVTASCRQVSTYLGSVWCPVTLPVKRFCCARLLA
jgi:hypothetical protein